MLPCLQVCISISSAYAITYLQVCISISSAYAIIICCVPQCQSVTTLMCDWWMAGTTMKDGWKSAKVEFGGLCVTITGVPLMLWWFADSWDYLHVVSSLGVKIYLPSFF